jgi:hypothetical protein
MQSLAIYVRDTHINRDVAQEINAGLHILQQEITALDEEFRKSGNPGDGYCG